MARRAFYFFCQINYAARLLIIGATARASAVVLEVDPLAELGGLFDRWAYDCQVAGMRECLQRCGVQTVTRPENVAPSTVDAPGTATNARAG